MMKITKGQIKKIHVALGQMLLRDEIYRDILWQQFQVTSCKRLDYRQAEELLAHFRSLGWKPTGKWGLPKKYDNLGSRPGMASARELRMIEVLWAEVCSVQREVWLSKFIEGQYGVSNIRFLRAEDAHKCIEALKAIVARKQQKKQEV